MWHLEQLKKFTNENTGSVNGEWLPIRPDNYKNKRLKQRIKEAWLVFIGRADCFIWPGGQ